MLNAGKLDFQKSKELPAIRNAKEIINTAEDETVPDGIGLFFVRSIKTSVFLS